jgi:serine/threonine-protein kinase
VGTRLAGYEITGVIGEGEMGVVYRGRRVARDTPLAIKVLHDHGARTKDVVEQLIGEVRAAGRVRHAHVVEVIDVDATPDGSVFLVMEHLDGESLRDRLRRVSRLPLFEAINILHQVARGLGAAHEAGIVHGRLKPANIFLCKRDGRRRIVRRSKATGMRLVVEPEQTFDLVKLLDFGMARFRDLAASAAARGGDVGSTVQYMSPEQLQGQPANQRSDIYSVGAVFYEMVSGTVPFGSEWLAEALKGQISDVVIAPSRRTPGAGIDARIDSLILRCLKKNPALRFASTAELCKALDTCVTDCAFLRDAHHLPGIMESGIDLSEATPKARQDPARADEQPVAAPVAVVPAAVPVVPVPAQARVEAAAAPTARAPAVVPVAVKPARARVASDAAVATSTRPKATATKVDDPAAAIVTPPPIVAPGADDPAAAVLTPPPVAARVRPESVADLSGEPGLRRIEQPDEILSAVGERPERSGWQDDDFSGRRQPTRSRRPQVMAVAFVLLLGGAGVTLWAARNVLAPGTTRPVVAARTAPVAAPAPSPLTGAAAPAAVPAAPVPVAPPPATPPPPRAEPPVAAPAPSAPPVGAAAAVAPARPAPLARAEATRAKARGPGKLAATRSHPTRAKGARRKAPLPPALSEGIAEPETAPAAQATPEPEAEAPTPSKAAAEAPTPSKAEAEAPTPSKAVAEAEAPAPSKAVAEAEPTAPAPPAAGDLVREAQLAWMRGHYALAISKAQAALDAGPKPSQAMQAYEVIGTSSCALRDADAARDAVSHLGEKKRETVKAVCEKNGVTIE